MAAFNTDFDRDTFLMTLTHRPGVYRMIDEWGKVLYVGKAKDLKKRVSSYFRSSGLSHRIHSMMQHTRQMEITVTHTEAEALLLENNLIKQHRPRYNVLLRDDKSYPYISISMNHLFPRMRFHRGRRRNQERYFGPYPSAGAVRETLSLLQKLFRVRQCDDAFFNARTRPCLQYQIRRCTAPCVGYIEADEYGQDVNHALKFLQGKSEEVVEALGRRMEEASQRLQFERAAEYRDQIEALGKVSQRQYVIGESGDLDIIACASVHEQACVQVFNVRGGVNLGNRSFFPQIPAQIKASSLMTAFLGQYYLNREVPGRIIVSHAPQDRAVLEQMLSDKSGHAVTVSHVVRGERARWLELAKHNADHALYSRLASRAGQLSKLEALQEVLNLEALPARMECFDVSHTQGEATVAACVVFDAQGPAKSAYRRFNIEGVEPGDDYAAMRQALMRRYKRLIRGEGELPDVLLLDGGKGQLRQAQKVFDELGIDTVTLVGVAKGVSRKPGLETLILCGESASVILPSHSSALHLVQQIRDEAHRFAITGHRQRRAKARNRSSLERIPGLGPKRRQRLLRHFGGLRGIERAGVEELTKVNGISDVLAQSIYDALHT